MALSPYRAAAALVIAGAALGASGCTAVGEAVATTSHAAACDALDETAASIERHLDRALGDLISDPEAAIAQLRSTQMTVDGVVPQLAETELAAPTRQLSDTVARLLETAERAAAGRQVDPATVEEFRGALDDDLHGIAAAC